MYYLRKESYEQTLHEMKKRNGEIIPERKYMVEERALYRADDCDRLYRRPFAGIDNKPDGFHLYVRENIEEILEQRQRLYDYCGEWFDVFNESGKIDIETLIS